MTRSYEDLFTRTVSGGIGRPDDYEPDGSVEGSSVDGEQAVMVTDSFAAWVWEGAPDAHGYYYFDFHVPSDLNEYRYWEIDTRKIDGFATYFYIYATGSGDIWEIGTDAESGTDWFEFTPTADTWYRAACHLDIDDVMVRMRVWPRDDPEPSTWDIEAPAETGISYTWTPYLILESGAQFDNFIVSDVPLNEEPPSFGIDSYIAGTLDITTDVGFDALIKRTIQYPYEPVLDAPEFFDSSTADGYGGTLSIDLPAGMEDGDTVVAAISWDSEGSSAHYLEMDYVEFATNAVWDYHESLRPSGFDQTLDIYSTTWRTGMPTTFGITTYTSQSGVDPVKNTSKAAAFIVFRGGGDRWMSDSIDFLDDQISGTYTSGAHFTPAVQLSAGVSEYGRRALWLGLWAGGGFGEVTWAIDDEDPPYDPYEAAFEEPMTQVVNVSADNWANLTAAVWYDPAAYISGRGMVPSSGELHLKVVYRIVAPTLRFMFDAWISGGFGLDAVVSAATHTTHLRTGPHIGVHPSSAIVSSATLGSLPAGTDLNTVLQDLDTLLTDLENQS